MNSGQLETDRIVLRPWMDSDAPALYKYASDPDVGPRAGWPPHKSVEESLEVIRTVFNDATNTWAIVLKETGEAISSTILLPAASWKNAASCLPAKPWWTRNKVGTPPSGY